MARNVTTSQGHIVDFSLVYTPGERAGVEVLTAASAISLISVVALLIILGVAAHRTIRTPTEHRFMRTHVVAYFISLLFCDVIASTGSLMNASWVSSGRVTLSSFCTSQAALKNAGNVGTAMWSVVIAIHTFCLLVLKWRSKDYILYITLFVVWSFVGLVVIIGPAAVQDLKTRGPYFGISGYWCWITDAYPVQRITLEYLWMFLSVFLSALLYSAVFLSLRGFLTVDGSRVHLQFRRTAGNVGKSWQVSLQTGKQGETAQATSFAKHMLLYPIAYSILILPIAICRFASWAGHNVPFTATIFADTIFLLSGFINVILFTTTRRLIPTPSSNRTLLSVSSTSSFSKGGPSEKIYPGHSHGDYGYGYGKSSTGDIESYGRFSTDSGKGEFLPALPYVIDTQRYYSTRGAGGGDHFRSSSSTLPPTLSLIIPAMPPQARTTVPAPAERSISHTPPRHQPNVPQTPLDTIPLTPADSPPIQDAFPERNTSPKRGISLAPALASLYSQASGLAMPSSTSISAPISLPAEPAPALPKRIAGPRRKPPPTTTTNSKGSISKGSSLDARETIGITDYYRYTALMNAAEAADAKSSRHSEAEPDTVIEDGVSFVPALPSQAFSRLPAPRPLPNPMPTITVSASSPQREELNTGNSSESQNAHASERDSYQPAPYPYAYIDSRSSNGSMMTARGSTLSYNGAEGNSSEDLGLGRGVNAHTIGQMRPGSGRSAGGRYL